MGIKGMSGIVAKLHMLERKVIPYLLEGISVAEIMQKTGMKEVEVMRAAQWLENKGVLRIKSDVSELLMLGEQGTRYAREGLPEEKLLQAAKNKTLSFSDASRIISRQELSAAIGVLKQDGAIEIKGQNIFITRKGEQYAKIDEKEFLNKLPKRLDKLNREENEIYKSLKHRKDIVKTGLVKIRTLHLTALGRELCRAKLQGDFADGLTPAMLSDGSWKDRRFRHFDVEINVPALNSGRRQPYAEFLSEIKIKLAEMGFEEMEGPLVETEFYNFDVLFQPQNHPARAWSDTYKLKNPVHGGLPRQHVINAVKRAHEDGWGYKWDESTARQLMLRAQGTALSARQLVKGIKIPGKYFAVARCFRPDVLDATHLIEFNQLEGFVADRDLTFKNLLGLLKQFANEIAGANAVKFIPDYYPFTEPSVQMNALHPKLGWIELGGAGMFRKEVVKTQKIDVPVIAWGLGIDRLAMFKLRLKDIRGLFSSDLNWLRNAGCRYA